MIANEAVGGSNRPETAAPHRYRSFWLTLAVILNYSLGSFYFGVVMVYISTFEFKFIVDIFGIDWPISTAQGLIVGIIPMGALFGSLLSEILLDKLSRRENILFANAIALIAGGLIFIQNPITLLIFRFFQGLCVGLYSAIVSICIQQTAPKELSGSLGSVGQIVISFGIFFSFLFKYILTEATGDTSGEHIWYYVFGLTQVTVLLQTFVLLFVFPFETVKYLLENDREEEAKLLISFLYKEEYVEEVLQEKIKDFDDDQKKKQVTQIQKLAEDSQANISVVVVNCQSNSARPHHHFVEIETPRLAVATGMHLFFLKQLSGLSAVVVYGVSTTKEAAPSLKNIIPIVVNFEQFIFPILLFSLLESWGRKTLIQWGTGISAFATGLIGAGFLAEESYPDTNVDSYLVIAGMVIFMANYGVTIGPIPWVYVAETVQPHYYPYATTVYWIGGTLVTILFPILKDALPNGNPAFLFLFFSFWSVISIIVNHQIAIEPKGKTERQIKEEFEKICY